MRRVSLLTVERFVPERTESLTSLLFLVNPSVTSCLHLCTSVLETLAMPKVVADGAVKSSFMVEQG